MNYKRVFDKYTFLPQKAEALGIERVNGAYSVKRNLREDGFYAVFRITDNSVEADVFEEPDGEEYLPFNVSADMGGFVSAIRTQVDEALNDVLREFFELSDTKSVLLDYVMEKYGTVPEAPWGYLKEYHTLNTAKKHKWYGIFMLIPYRYLGIEKEGKIHVLNLKVKTEDIAAIIDNVHYFPSYHMNKKYWISVLLDRNADIERIKGLLDNSYTLVEGTGKRGE